MTGVKTKYLNMLYIYTDGGCRPNDGTGAGAYAIAVIEENSIIFEQSERFKPSTNNRMELTGMANALAYAAAFPNKTFTIVTDSQYVKNGLESWIHGWIKKGWINSAKEPVKNRDLWEIIHRSHQNVKNVAILWTKGHSDNEWNNHVDQLCTRTLLDDSL